jgi:uncharacterized protein
MLLLAIIGILAFIGLVFGPQFWINWTLKKHGEERPEMPGTGGELARHLLDDAGLQDVKVDMIPRGDHYSVDDKTVRCSP